jgi:hypothetical protein
MWHLSKKRDTICGKKDTVVELRTVSIKCHSNFGQISRPVWHGDITGLFGLRETRRKERGRRESWENILLSIVWFAIKKGRKENIWLGPTQKVFLPKLDGKWNKTCYSVKMTQMPIKFKKNYKFRHVILLLNYGTMFTTVGGLLQNFLLLF